MTSPKQCGGGGIKDLKVFNRSLLSKWLWKFGMEGESLWIGVVADKYGVMEGG